MSGRRKLRLRILGRRLFLAVSLAAVAGGMIRAVERGAEARRTSEQITELERRLATEQARVAKAMRRVDSLTGRDRIGRAARRLGLRPAGDDEIVFLRGGTSETGRKGR